MKKFLLTITLLSFIFPSICFSGGPICGGPIGTGGIDMSAPGPIGETTPSNATFQDTITLRDAIYIHIIKAVNEPGLNGRLTIGLDEVARTMVICDAGDVDIDFGLSVSSVPRLVITNATGYPGMNITNDTIYRDGGGLKIQSYSGFTMAILADKSAGNVFRFDSSVGAELTDTNAEQSWVYIEPKINQSATAAYNGLKIKITETATGDATTGEGGGTNNLILAGTSVDPDMFKVENDGDLTMSVGKLSAAAMTFAFTTEVDITDPLTGSIVLLDGDNDGENDTIDLQNGTTIGQVLYLIAAVDIDNNDTCTINYGDTTCTNCPATVFDKVGENAHLVWTGSTWIVISLQNAL